MGEKDEKQNRIVLTRDTVIRPNGFRCTIEGPWTLCPMDPSEFNLQELTVIATAIAAMKEQGMARVVCEDILRKIEEHCQK
jgi:hypothetical protein